MFVFSARTRLFPSLTRLFFLLLAITSSVHAQSVDVYLGLGTATDSATSIPFTQDGVSFFPTEPLGGLFGLIGGDVMITPNLGIGAEQAFRFSSGDYVADLGVRTRVSFFDINAVYQPWKGLKAGRTEFVPVFQGGIGLARVGFYQYQQSCDDQGNCSTANTHIDQTNRPQLHFSGGMKWQITEHVFVRPQVDVHWIAGFDSAPVYGRNWVPQYTIAIGYKFGGFRNK
jgi:hypothetical protein